MMRVKQEARTNQRKALPSEAGAGVGGGACRAPGSLREPQQLAGPPQGHKG